MRRSNSDGLGFGARVLGTTLWYFSLSHESHCISHCTLTGRIIEYNICAFGIKSFHLAQRFKKLTKKMFLIFLNNSLFISMCILRDLPQQKNPRALSGGSFPNFICSHVPMGIFLLYETGKKRR